ncbi:MAG TPA: phage tail protein, partial [Acinetobacter sp.]|nr:phage tail protein [Acinetobacter sp.]
MKKVIICPDPYNQSTWSTADVDDVSAYLKQQFTIFPKNTRIYHNAVAESNDITPQNEMDIKHLQSLDGVFYVVIYPSWIQIIYYAIVAIIAAYSIYTILTMPKPELGAAGSANNELSNRSNRLRVNGRVPDIFGQVRAYPDLIAVIYSYYLDNIEIEETLMCVGRGSYQIHDCRDGDTDVNGIDGVSVSIYDPNVSIVGTDTIYQVGQPFSNLPLDVAKSSSINGQTLVKPNDLLVESSSIYFATGGVIHRTDGSIDFTDYFSVGDGLGISGAQFGIDNTVLSGDCIISSDFKVTIDSEIDIPAYDDYKGILLNGATVEITTIDPITSEETINTYDLSGQYIVSSVTRSLVGSTYTYVVQLDSPKQVNYNWNYIDTDYDITSGITLNNNIGSVDLDANYSVSIVTASSITLANASTVNPDWDKIPTLFDGSTQSLNDGSIYLELVASKWIGWFDIFKNDATHLNLNVYFPGGLWNQDSKGRTNWAWVRIAVEYQIIDDNGDPISEVFDYEYYSGHQTKRYGFGISINIELPETGNVRFRAAKTSEHQGNNPT